MRKYFLATVALALVALTARAVPDRDARNRQLRGAAVLRRQRGRNVGGQYGGRHRELRDGRPEPSRRNNGRRRPERRLDAVAVPRDHRSLRGAESLLSLPVRIHDAGAVHDGDACARNDDPRRADRGSVSCRRKDLPVRYRHALPGQQRRRRDEGSHCDVHGRGRVMANARAATVIVASVASLLIGVGAASADRGVALDLGRLDVAQTLTPGGGYRLPPLGVRNPGDEVTSYRLVVSHFEGQPGKPIPARWVRFEPNQLTLKPGRT